MLPQSVLIFGATSDIAAECAKQLARKGVNLVLCARNMDALNQLKMTLLTNGSVTIHTHTIDVDDVDTINECFNDIVDIPVVTILAIGYLGDEQIAQTSDKERDAIIRRNLTGPIHILDRVAEHYKKRRCGHILGISSVAGERGRASNGHYGAAKAGLTTYLSALRNRLTSLGVYVTTIKPGFIRSKMTIGIPFPSILIGDPEKVASDIVDAIRNKKDSVITPMRWRPIMLCVRWIPEWLFKRRPL